MLFPYSHAWTQLQRWLIITVVVLVLGSLGTLVSYYERYHRGPSDSVLFGKWETASFNSDSPFYFQFGPDHTFLVSSSPAMDEESVFATGRWYAGGKNIYLRFNVEPMGTSRLQVWHIVDISPHMFRIRLFRDGAVYVYQRLAPAARLASNQTMPFRPIRQCSGLSRLKAQSWPKYSL